MQIPESTLKSILQRIESYLELTERGKKWPVVCKPQCTHCGVESIGWGWYRRLLRLGKLVEPVSGFWVKRFQCKSETCGRTFSLLPAFVLVLKRYAAEIVQCAWEERVEKEPRTLEDIAARWQLPCVLTVQRWLHPLRSMGEALKREIRHHLPLLAPGQFDHVSADDDELLALARQVAAHTPTSPFDRSRVPYHFVFQLIRRLRR